MGCGARQNAGATHYPGARERNRPQALARQLDERADPALPQAEGAEMMKRLIRVPSAHSVLLPLPLGEGWGEGLSPLDKSGPPHPNPLPDGERECAGVH